MNQVDYNEEFDVFEAPETLWSGIEAQLDKKTKRKRPFLLWISVAGAAAVLLIAIVATQVISPKENTKRTGQLALKQDIASDSTSEGKEYHFGGIVPLDNGPELSKENNTPPTPPEDQMVLNNTYEITLQLTPNTNQMNPFAGGSGGGQGGGNGSGYGAVMGTYQWSSNFSSGTVNNAISSSQSYSATYSQSLHFGLVGNIVTRNPVHQGYAPDPFSNDGATSQGSTYDSFDENVFIEVDEEPQSTFSIDVDGASYSDVRGMINRNVLPNPDAVRLEEFINYFPYEYAEPTGDHPFSIHSEVTDCPWNGKHKLMKIGIKGESIPSESLPKNNLVFLLDVSGSMMSADKLELLKKGFNLLVQEMREQDKISICVYAGAAGLVLPPTSGAHKDQIMDAINRLEAGGSTAGGQGIELAYATAVQNFDPNGNNRVILATDGDFNVGLSDDDALVQLIEEKRKSGVFLTVLGFGHDNFQSSKMEKLANNGNGNFSYIDNILEAKKVLVTEMGATLRTIAKDVKIQLDFNNEKVESYRLIGYENRMLANEDFANDEVDAGELGAGHTVTAVYEIVPAEGAGTSSGSNVGGAAQTIPAGGFANGELAVLKFRYKKPDESTSRLIETSISNSNKPASADMQFISAVIEFGLILRNSQFKGTASFDNALRNARLGLGLDPYGYRSEFIHLVEKAERLSNGSSNE